MASPAYLTTDFIADVRAAASLPNSVIPGTSDLDILRYGNTQMRGHVSGLVRRLSEEYYIRRYDLLSPAGQRSVRIPSRAVGDSTRTVDYFAGPSSNGINTYLLRSLQRVEADNLPAFQPTDQYQGLPWGFYLEASTINLVPIPSGLGTLRVRVQQRPGAMVLDTDTAQCGKITSVANTTVGGNACYLLGSAVFNGAGQSALDVIAGTNPFEALASGAATQGAMTLLQSDFTTPPAVGDWVTLTDVSPVVQLPPEAEPLLVYYTAAAVALAKGRTKQGTDMMNEAKDMAQEIVATMAPRTKGNSRVCTGGIYHTTRGPFGFWRY